MSTPPLPDPRVLGEAVLDVAKAVGIDPASLSQQEIDFCIKKAFEIRTELWINKEHKECAQQELDNIRESMNLSETLNKVRMLYARDKMPRRKYKTLKDLVDAQIELAEAEFILGMKGANYIELIADRALDILYSSMGVERGRPSGKLSLSYTGKEQIDSILRHVMAQGVSAKATRSRLEPVAEALLLEKLKEENGKLDEVFRQQLESAMEGALHRYTQDMTKSLISDMLNANLSDSTSFVRHVTNVVAASVSTMNFKNSTRVQNRVKKILAEISKETNKEDQ